MTFKVIHRYVYESTLSEKKFKSGSKTLSEIVKDLGYVADFSGIVFIDDDKKASSNIDAKFWDYIKPKKGTYLIVQSPAGSSLKKIAFSVIAIAAISVGQPWLAGQLSFLGAAAGTVAGIATAVGLSFLQQALIPYESPDNNRVTGPASSPTLNISGSQNQVRAGAPVPYHIGTNRFVPPLAAQPVREANGKDVYFNQVFMIGYAPCIVSELKIGDTAIENFSDVQIQINDGYSSSDQITTIKGDITIQSGLSIELAKDTPQIITGGEFAEKAALVFAFNGGLVNIAESGAYQNRSVSVKIEYKPVSAGTWTVLHESKTFSDSTVEQTFRTIDIPVLVKDQYEFRVTRLTADSTSSRVRDNLTLISVKTTQLTDDNDNALVTFPDGFAYIGIRIKASDQLSGTISQLSCKVQSVPEVYDDNTQTFSRVPDQSGNNAWEYLTLLRSEAAKKTVDNANLDLDQFIAWADRCNTLVSDKPRHRINHVVDYSGRQESIMTKIASTGRAAKAEVDGVKTVILDVGGKPAIQKFTNSNSSGFSATKVFAKKPDAFKCKFVNPAKDWTLDNINIRRDDNQPDASSDIIEELDCIGITDVDELYRYAKFAHAQIELRPETYNLNVGVESLFTTKGDIVVISHDRIQGDVISSRVSSTSGNDAVLISTIDVDPAKDYFVSFRHSQSAQTSDIYPVTIVDNVVTLLVTAASANVLAGDMVLIGTQAETVDRKYIIKEVSNGEDLNASLTLVDYADPDIYSSENGTIVNYNPGFFKPSINDFSRPLPPTILDIITDERALLVNADGSFSARVSIEILGDDTDSTVSPEFIDVSYRPTNSDGYYKHERYPAEQTLIYANDVFEGTTYDVRVRYVTPAGATSLFAVQNSVFVTGKTTPPDDVENFQIENNSGNVLLTWAANDDIDLAGYVVKFSSALTGATWASSSIVAGSLGKSVTQVTLPSRIGSYLIKAVDTGGRESINETITTNNIQSIIGFNVVETRQEDDQFLGAKVDCGVSDNELRLKDSLVINDWPIINEVGIINAVGPIAPEGIYNFDTDVDLGGVFDSRLSVELESYGIDYAQTINSWGIINNIGVINGDNVTQWGVIVQLRTTQDDPVLNNWSAWSELTIGDSKARGYQFRAVLSSFNDSVTPSVVKLRVIIDMPDRVESGDNITSPIGGIIVSYDNGAFNAVPSVVVDGENMNTGDYHRVTSKTTEDFIINFYNSADANISRSFDYVASGYGFEQ